MTPQIVSAAPAPAPMASAPLAFLRPRAALVLALLLCVLCHLPAPCASQAARGAPGGRGQGGVARRTSGSRVGGGARGWMSGRARGGGGGGGASRSRRGGVVGGAGRGRYSRPSSLKRLPTPTTTAVAVGRARLFRDAWRAAGRAAGRAARPPGAGKAAAAMKVKKRPPAVAAKVPGEALLVLFPAQLSAVLSLKTSPEPLKAAGS